MFFKTLLLTVTMTSTLIIAAPAPAPDSATTTPAPSLASLTGDLQPTGSLGLPPDSINSTETVTSFQAAAASTGLPTIPIIIINNTVADQAAGTGLPTIPISIVNNTVAAVSPTDAFQPSAALTAVPTAVPTATDGLVKKRIVLL